MYKRINCTDGVIHNYQFFFAILTSEHWSSGGPKTRSARKPRFFFDSLKGVVRVVGLAISCMFFLGKFGGN